MAPLTIADAPPFLLNLRTPPARPLWEREPPAIERDRLLATVFETLLLPEKRSVILTGNSGVGKTALMYEVIRRIVGGNVPSLQKRELFLLDIPLLLRSTKDDPLIPGALENRLRAADEYTSGLLEGAVIFADEIGRLFELPGVGGQMKITDHLKESLARGLILFGNTTERECEQILSRDPALERRLNRLTVLPMTTESAAAVLRAGNNKREQYYSAQVGGRKVRVPDAVLREAVHLADRHFKARPLPDAALAVIERTCVARVHRIMSLRLEVEEVVGKIHVRFGAALRASRDAEEEELVGAKKELVRLATRYYRLQEQIKEIETEGDVRVVREDLLEAVAFLTKIPVAKLGEDEKEKLLRLEDILSRRVIRQETAKAALANAVRRARTLPKPGAPYGVFLFAGPTGVGKTELAKALAEALLGSEAALVRFDMGEFREKHTSARLIGAPPGYVGYNEGGELTEAIRRTPYCVVLLDEYEKAHPDIWNTLLTALGEARLTDGKGQTVDCSNVVWIMTSNLAARKIQESVHGVEDPEERRRIRGEIFEGAMKTTFPPEFRGRLTEVIYFDDLAQEDLPNILRIKMARLERQMREKGHRLEVSQAVRMKIVDEGYDSELGARPMERALARILEDPLATALVAGTIAPRSIVRADLNEAGGVTLSLQGEIPREEFRMPESDGRVAASVYRLLALLAEKTTREIVEVSRDEMSEILSPREERVEQALSDAVAAGLMPVGSLTLTDNDFRRKDPAVVSLAATLAALGRIGNFRPGAAEALSEFAHVISAVAKEAASQAGQADRRVEIVHNFQGDLLSILVRTARIDRASPLGKRLEENLKVPGPASEEEERATYRRLQRGGDMRLLRLSRLVTAAGGSVGFEEEGKGSTFFLLFRPESPKLPPPPPTAPGPEPQRVSEPAARPSPPLTEEELFGGPKGGGDRPLNADEFVDKPAPPAWVQLSAAEILAEDSPPSPRPPLAPLLALEPAPPPPPVRPRAERSPFPRGYFGPDITSSRAWGEEQEALDPVRFFPGGASRVWKRRKSVPLLRLMNLLSYRADSSGFVFMFPLDRVEEVLKTIAQVARAETDMALLKDYLNRLVDNLGFVRSDIRPSERATATALFTTLFHTLAGHDRNGFKLFCQDLIPKTAGLLQERHPEGVTELLREMARTLTEQPRP